MWLISQQAGSPLRGNLRPPSDKSITHRALILASLARGTSRLESLLDAEDTRATRAACAQLGARFEDQADGSVLVHGVAGVLQPPAAPLDMGNSGTAMRLLSGVLAAQSFDSTVIGDASLSRRPMGRIVQPLTEMGAQIETAKGGTPPLQISGVRSLRGIDYASPVASAQVKSCVLLAGLFASGTTRVTEPLPSRDHTERMLPEFGVELDGPICVTGGSALHGTELRVPADPSSAAFLLAAAALVPGSEVLVREVGINPTREGVLHALVRMGAQLERRDQRLLGGEPVADIALRAPARLRAICVGAEEVPALIDELPLLMALAAAADGTSEFRGAAELRVKESDRISVMCQALAALGVQLEELEDGARITGGAIGGASVNPCHDHRCAMALAVLGLASARGIRIEAAEWIATSYPEFMSQMLKLGAPLQSGEGS